MIFSVQLESGNALDPVWRLKTHRFTNYVHLPLDALYSRIHVVQKMSQSFQEFYEFYVNFHSNL